MPANKPGTKDAATLSDRGTERLNVFQCRLSTHLTEDQNKATKERKERKRAALLQNRFYFFTTFLPSTI